jgi:peptidoglycan-associated lipoprotein
LKNIGNPQLLFPENNRAGNESSPVLTKDGKTIYFTRNDQEKISTIEDEKSYFLKIYKASLIDNKWQNIEELPFCSNTFNTANPALSPDEHILYFASDRPGTNGQSDIYKVIIYYDGSYSKPINLKLINTSSKENFPFISKENKFYFSSNGHLGLGGLDIYSFDFKTNTLKNLGDKINSSQDDFSIFIDDKYGFLSSNRIGGNGFDDIYKFSIIEEGQITQIKETATKFPVQIGDDLAKKIALKPIYFDLNKWDIRTDASLEIDKIFEIMNKYPNLIIAINAHTDCRNSEEYNKILSQKRADETRNHLISKGINATRLIAKGFGESLLLNTCKDGENCTEEEHQQNRRSEFIVVQF